MPRPSTAAAAALALAVIAAAAIDVSAHAVLERTEPRQGSTVTTSPREIRLWFSQPLEPAFSGAQVLGEGGRRVEGVESRVDASAPAQLRIPLPPLAAGTYTVRWRVVSVDTHVTEGDLTFTIAP